LLVGIPGWLVGFSIAAAGYLLRFGQDWLAWWRQDVHEDRDRWKSARLQVLLDLGDTATDFITLARRYADAGVSAWSDPAFTRSFSELSAQWRRLNQRTLLLVAHRDTLLDLQQLDGALFRCFPERDPETLARDVAALTSDAEHKLWKFAHLARYNELRLQTVGIEAQGADVSKLEQRLYPVKRWLRERRRG
jgi:hypothetical protein